MPFTFDLIEALGELGDRPRGDELGAQLLHVGDVAFRAPRDEPLAVTLPARSHDSRVRRVYGGHPRPRAHMPEDETLRLYDYPASCNCYKVRLLLAQLGRPYERVRVDIFDGETLTDEFAAINPARSTPVLETPDGYLPESNAILLYLAQGTDLLPADPFEAAQVVRWLIFEQTDVIPAIGGLRFRLLVGRWTPDHPEAVRRREAANGVLRLLDDHLETRRFAVADRYTIADIALYGYTHRAYEAGIDLEPFPHVRSWLARVEQRTGYIEDVAPYGANAAPGAGRSIYG